MLHINYKSITLLLISFVLILPSCGSENKLDQSMLIGRWEVYQGERNGKPTQTLNGAYFEFMPSNQLATNILGEGQMTGYNVYDGEIVQQGGEKIRYKIEELTDSKMTLSTKIRQVDFVLDLVKSSTL